MKFSRILKCTLYDRVDIVWRQGLFGAILYTVYLHLHIWFVLLTFRCSTVHASGEILSFFSFFTDLRTTLKT